MTLCLGFTAFRCDNKEERVEVYTQYSASIPKIHFSETHRQPLTFENPEMTYTTSCNSRNMSHIVKLSSAVESKQQVKEKQMIAVKIIIANKEKLIESSRKVV